MRSAVGAAEPDRLFSFVAACNLKDPVGAFTNRGSAHVIRDFSTKVILGAIEFINLKEAEEGIAFII